MQWGATLAETGFTDLGIELSKSMVAPAAYVIDQQGFLHFDFPASWGSEILLLAENLKLHLGRLDEVVAHGGGQAEFAFSHNDCAYRGRRMLMSNDQLWVFLRRVPAQYPSLGPSGAVILGIPEVTAKVLRETGDRPGLILVGGRPRSGKTHTAVGLYSCLLAKRGGIGISIEDPVEFALNGALPGNGTRPNAWSMQVDVSGFPGGAVAGYADACRAAFRMSSSLAYIGELRDGPVANECLRAARGAFTVITTIHGETTVDILRRAAALLRQTGLNEETIWTELAGTLSAVVCQKLVPRQTAESKVMRPTLELLMVNAGSVVPAQNEAAIRAIIRRGGDLRDLDTVMTQQRNRLGDLMGER